MPHPFDSTLVCSRTKRFSTAALRRNFHHSSTRRNAHCVVSDASHSLVRSMGIHLGAQNISFKCMLPEVMGIFLFAIRSFVHRFFAELCLSSFTWCQRGRRQQHSTRRRKLCLFTSKRSTDFPSVKFDADFNLLLNIRAFQ